MKRIFLIFLTVIFSSLQLTAQKTSDAVYLKNGIVIYGYFVQVSDSLYKIRASDGILYSFPADQVEKYTMPARPDSSLNQEQTLAWYKANKKISTGKTLTILGGIVGFVGLVSTIHILDEASKQVTENSNPIVVSIGLTGCGIGAIIVGTNKWRSGKKKIKKIELELVKYKSPGTASINGVGIKIRF